MTPSPDRFLPDLVVEATNACDKVCPGCYAPNVLVAPGAKDSRGDARHLTVELLADAWPAGEVGVVSVRGGEPTLNPGLPALLRWLASRARRVYLETNGGWIAAGHPLLPVLAELGCVVKLSADRMHATSADDAAARLAILSAAGVEAAAAVTEETQEGFAASRARLLAGFSGEVIWQRKAASAAALIQPRLGVVSARGERRRGLTNLLPLATS